MLVPIVFVMENICFISWVIRKGNSEYDDDDDDEEEEEEDEAEEEVKAEEILAPAGLGGDTRPATELEADLAKAAALAKASQGACTGG